MFDQINQNYLIESSLILAIGYLVYHIFFAEDKAFIRNRIYLLSLLVISFLLPLLSIPVFARQVIMVPQQSMLTNIKPNLQHVANSLDVMGILYLIYISVAALLSLRLIYNITYILKVLVSSETVIRNKVKYIITDRVTTPSSFFNYLIVDSIDIPNEIINHEKVHITHRHTWDILLSEIAKIFLWFNPFVYLTAKSLKENHEFIADHLAAASMNSELDYSSILIQYAKSNNVPVLINTFSSITKKRIIMLSKNQISNRWKSFLIIPILLGIISLFAFESYSVPVGPNGEILTDTIPDVRIDTITTFDYDTYKETVEIVRVYPNDMIVRTDTVTVFDSDTKKESVQIVKSESPRIEVLQETYYTNEYIADKEVMETRTYTRYPQEQVSVTDTITTFDYDTYEEKVTVVKGSRPREELISTIITPKDQIKEGQKFDNVFKSTDKIIVKKKGN